MNDLVRDSLYALWQFHKNSAFAGTALTMLAGVAITRLQGTAAYGSRRFQSARRWLVSNAANPELQQYQAVEP